MSIGDTPECSAVLKFTGQGTNTEIPELQHFKKSHNEVDFDNVKVVSKALIVPRDSKINVKFEHAPPALVGECYEIYISIVNRELCAIKDLRVEVSADEDNSEGMC